MFGIWGLSPIVCVGPCDLLAVPSAWIGIEDFVREGTWVTSSDLQRATYFNWQHGQPDNSNGVHEGGEDCVIVHSGGGWDDYFCDSTHNTVVVCESP